MILYVLYILYNVIGVKALPKKIEINLHGLEVLPAKKKLEKLLASCDNTVTEIVVIHGYHNGTGIKDMIKNELRSKRISVIQPSILNPGVTTIYLKRK